MFVYTEDSTVKDSRQELFVQNFARVMNLQKIKNGSDGLYIRIWLWPRKKVCVININKNQKRNECQIIEFNSEIKGSIEYIVIRKDLKNLTPKSGWKEFFETINKYKIPILESGTIQNSEKLGLTEASYVQIEIAEPGKYRFYEYLEPSYYKDMDEKSKMVATFLRYFNDEMNVKVY